MCYALILFGSSSFVSAQDTLFVGRSFPTDSQLWAAYGDMNGDGNIDAVTAEMSASLIGVRLGNGRGEFFRSRTFPVSISFNAMVDLADLNGDGNLDAVTLNLTTSVVTVLLGDGTGALGSPASFPVGSGPTRLAFGDVDGDGKLDIVCSCYTSNSITMLRGDGLGGVLSTQTVGGGGSPFGIAVADFNSDGRADVVCTNFLNSTATVLLGSNSGMQLPALTYPVTGMPRSVAIGDLNQDGSLDFATSNEAGPNLTVALGTGSGTFLPAQILGPYPSGANPQRPYNFVLRDFNGDGKLDFIVVSNYGLYMLFGNGAGGIGSVAWHSTQVLYSTHLAVLDFNHDGIQDLATGFAGPDIHVLLGTGGGQIVDHVRGPPADSSRGVAVGDLNGDGLDDIATTTHSYPNSLTVYLGTNQGTYTSASYLVADTAYEVVMADVNADGALDLITSTVGPGVPAATVLLNNGLGVFGPAYMVGQNSQSRSIRVADVTGDGLPDIVGAGFYFAGLGGGTFGPSVLVIPLTGFNADVEVGDLNGDSRVDIVTTGYSSANSILIAYANSTGGFLPPVSVPVGNGPTAIVVGDFNLDGIQDIATANQNSFDVSVLIGLGAGQFAPAMSIKLPGTPQSMFVKDMNLDGVPDIVVSGLSITVLIGLGSGQFTRTNYSALDSGGPAIWSAAADMDLDGRPDLLCSSTGPNLVVMLNRLETPMPVSVCAGDGSGAACPCAHYGTLGRGCGNSNAASGARLGASGVPSIAQDTFTLNCTGQPDGIGLFFQGRVPIAGGAGMPFGEGVLCLGGSLRRLALVATQAGAVACPSGIGHEDSLPLSVRGSAVAGAVIGYQFWFRDPASSCMSAGYNLSNAIMIHWTP